MCARDIPLLESRRGEDLDRDCIDQSKERRTEQNIGKEADPEPESGPDDIDSLPQPHSVGSDSTWFPYGNDPVSSLLEATSRRLKHVAIMAAPTTSSPAAAAAATTQTSVTGRPRLVFVDGTFAELVQELADYLHVGEAVEPLLAQEKNEQALAKVVEASAALSAVPEKEFTGAYNLLIHLVVNESKDASPYLRTICQNLLQPVTSSPVNGPALALNALQAIFNLLAPTNGLRYNVLLSILRFARVNGFYDNLKPTLPNLPRWLQEWDVDEEAQRKIYLEIATIASEGGEDEEAYQYLLKVLRTFDAADEAAIKSDEAAALSVRAVRMALLSSTHFDFQDLRVLPTVQALADSHAAYAQLLDIFAEQDLEDYRDFCEEHDGWVEQEGMDDGRLQRKMRLLTFTSLAAASTQSREIEYGRIAKALQIPVEDVEVWAIDVIRAGLVEGKMSQQKRLFLVHRTTYRVFGEKQWRELGTRLDQWRGSLRSVLAVLRRQQAEADAQREREAQELERKLAGASLGAGGDPSATGAGGASSQRRGGGIGMDGKPRQPFQQRQHMPHRNENDD
ncbi:pci domain containing protein [Grosmannia clavigera kw1407]|uniref:Eukaryotic translation initiation factor 3 subunit M n=1 Tax=Grosmannia clavigera (strain kw1407 / UAMH 11150) TaxID=655863 RepID=F0XKJ9_GROCL|nr:pci domain containing protein [Grosmannia clavigera kw1407]EFX01820.1 pci domain containing protein [Grosmannia clavigera kw1407]